MDAGTLVVPEGWVWTECGNARCDQGVWVPDLSTVDTRETLVVPVCSVACATAIVKNADIDMIVP